MSDTRIKLIDVPVAGAISDTDRLFANVGGDVVQVPKSVLLNGLPFVKTITGVNLKVAGQTSFFTVPVGKRFICLGYVIAPTAVNNVTAPGAFAPFAGGGNQLAADTLTANLLNNSFTLVDCIVQLVNFSDPLIGGQWGVAVAGDNINWNIIFGATATALIADVSIIGYFI